MFRNSEEEKALKEIEITFSLRHPNVIGLYAWFKEKGKNKKYGEMGMILELADRGDLETLYKKDSSFTLQLGLQLVTGVSKGLAYMHTMPIPIVHRDVKSGNIMIVDDHVGILYCTVLYCRGEQSEREVQAQEKSN